MQLDINKSELYIIMNENQLLFINSPIENSKLLGIPGGGKTTTIIHKILNHLKKKILL